MSLDIWLTEKNETELMSKNITHNLSGMWKEVGVYDALYLSEGKTANEVLPILEEGLEEMVNEPERFKPFEATNGWGLYKNAVTWLSELISEFKKHPNGVIGVSR